MLFLPQQNLNGCVFWDVAWARSLILLLCMMRTSVIICMLFPYILTHCQDHRKLKKSFECESFEHLLFFFVGLWSLYSMCKMLVGFLCVHVQLQVGVMCVCLCDVGVCVMCVWCMCLMCVCVRECLCLWPSIIQVQLCLETSHCHVLHILFCAICKYFTPCCVQAAKCSQLFFVPLFSVLDTFVPFLFYFAQANLTAKHRTADLPYHTWFIVHEHHL